MSYTDTSFAVQSTYTYIHGKQVYDQFAAQLGAHSAWSFVESVDYVNGTTTITTYVWKCLAASSGLPADFYVGFRSTAVSGVYSTSAGLGIVLFESYNSTTHVASKLACRSDAASQTTNADATNASTWTLSTAIPGTAPNLVFYANAGPVANSTGFRLLLTVVKDGVKGMWKDTQATPVTQQFYAGVFDTTLTGTDDPMPLMVSTGGTNTTNTAAASNMFICFTRHPRFGSFTGQYLFTGTYGFRDNNVDTAGVGNMWGNAPAPWRSLTSTQGLSAFGSVGYATDTSWNLFLGGAAISRCCITHYNNAGGSPSTRGSFRGYLKDIVTPAGALAAHAFGDTFLIDAKAYAASGNVLGWGILDTTA